MHVHAVNDIYFILPHVQVYQCAIAVVITFFVTLVALMTAVIVLAIVIKCKSSNSHRATVTAFNSTKVDLDDKY